MEIMVDKEAKIVDIVNQIHYLAFKIGPTPIGKKLRNIADELSQIGIDYCDLLAIDRKYGLSLFELKDL